MYPRNSFSNLRLPAKTHAALKKESKRLGKPMTDIMKDLVEKFLMSPKSDYQKKKIPSKKKTSKKLPAKKQQIRKTK